MKKKITDKALYDQIEKNAEKAERLLADEERFERFLLRLENKIKLDIRRPSEQQNHRSVLLL